METCFRYAAKVHRGLVYLKETNLLSYLAKWKYRSYPQDVYNQTMQNLANLVFSRWYLRHRIQSAAGFWHPNSLQLPFLGHIHLHRIGFRIVQTDKGTVFIIDWIIIPAHCLWHRSAWWLHDRNTLSYPWMISGCNVPCRASVLPTTPAQWHEPDGRWNHSYTLWWPHRATVCYHSHTIGLSLYSHHLQSLVLKTMESHTACISTR